MTRHVQGKAWVIVFEGTQHPDEVVAMLSARMGVASVGEFLENLYPLICGLPSSVFDAARYQSARPYCPAERGTTNTGVQISTVVRCGHNPYLEAVLASDVVLEVSDADIGEQGAVLHWTHPVRLVCSGPHNNR